jgi:hypothetical protein
MGAPTKKTTRRVGTARQPTATEQYVAKASKGRVNPLFWILGGMGGVLSVVTLVAFMGPGGNAPPWT